MYNVSTHRLLALLVLLWATPSAAQLNLMGPQPSPFTDPGGRFSCLMPVGWVVEELKDPNTLYFRPTSPVIDAFIAVRIIPAQGAAAKHLALRARDERLGKMPLFEQQGAIREVLIGGTQAFVVSGHYAYQGNVAYPRFIEEVTMVRGSQAYSIHFEAPLGQARQHGAALEIIYRSFQPGDARMPSGDPFGIPAEPSQPEYIPPQPL